MQDTTKAITSDSLGDGGKKPPEQGVGESSIPHKDVPLPEIHDAESELVEGREKSYEEAAKRISEEGEDKEEETDEDANG